MKFTTLFYVLLMPMVLMSQVAKFEVNNFENIEPIIQYCDTLSSQEIYEKTSDWINLVYTNSDKVIDGKVENDFIRFSGIAKEIFIVNGANPFDLQYTLRIDFKDNKYRLSLESYAFISHYSGGSFQLNYWIKGKGDRRKGTKMYYKASQALIDEINNINYSLYEYIIGKTKDKKDDW